MTSMVDTIFLPTECWLNWLLMQLERLVDNAS